MLRERLIDGLIPAYYLRTLQWGALTRVISCLAILRFFAQVEEERNHLRLAEVGINLRFPPMPKAGELGRLEAELCALKVVEMEPERRRFSRRREGRASHVDVNEFLSIHGRGATSTSEGYY